MSTDMKKVYDALFRLNSKYISDYKKYMSSLGKNTCDLNKITNDNKKRPLKNASRKKY
jgi:hypothetical protein